MSGATSGDGLALPTLSVVVMSYGPVAALHRALALVLERTASVGVELIVARNCPIAELNALRAAYPEVAFAEDGDGASSMELRTRGMAIAQGDIVTLRLDAEVGDAQWLLPFVAPRPTRVAAPDELLRPMGVHVEPHPAPTRPAFHPPSPRVTDAPFASDR